MDHSASSKKLDFGIFFNPTHPNVSKLVNPILDKMPSLKFSPAEDKADSPQLVSIEVKSPDGSEYTSSLQLITWLAAGLQQLRELREQALLASGKGESEKGKRIENHETHPLHSFGISIVGHRWLIFAAVKNDDDDGDVVSGLPETPTSYCNMGFSSSKLISKKLTKRTSTVPLIWVTLFHVKVFCASYECSSGSRSGVRPSIGPGL